MAEANDRIAAAQFISMAGTLVLVYGAGSAAGPLLGSLVMGRAGAGGLFIGIAITQVIFVAFATYRIPRREAVLEHIKKAFVHIPQTTPIAPQLRKGRNGRRA